MKESGTLNIFLGVLSFIIIWFVASVFLKMELTGRILDKFMNIGLLILVIIFQEQIKRFLVEIGSHRRWRFVHNMFRHRSADNKQQAEWIMPIVYACLNMSKSKTGALIVIKGLLSLENYAQSGDIIDAAINSRLIENIFFKNSPLHDGAMIVSDGRTRCRMHPPGVARRQCAQTVGAAPPLGIRDVASLRCFVDNCIGRDRQHLNSLQWQTLAAFVVDRLGSPHQSVCQPHRRAKSLGLRRFITQHVAIVVREQKGGHRQRYD